MIQRCRREKFSIKDSISLSNGKSCAEQAPFTMTICHHSQLSKMKDKWLNSWYEYFDYNFRLKKIEQLRLEGENCYTKANLFIESLARFVSKQSHKNGGENFS